MFFLLFHVVTLCCQLFQQNFFCIYTMILLNKTKKLLNINFPHLVKISATFYGFNFMNSIKLGLNYDIAFLLDDDLFFFKLVVLLFLILLKLEQKLLGLLEFFSPVGLTLCLIFLLGLLLLFKEFALVVLFTSVFGTEDSFQICISLFLVKYNGGVSLTALVVVMFLVSVLV